MIEFKCIECNHAIEVDDSQADGKMACPECETVVRVPAYTGQGDFAPGAVPVMLAGVIVVVGALYAIGSHASNDLESSTITQVDLLVTIRSWLGFSACCLLAGVVLLAVISVRLSRQARR